MTVFLRWGVFGLLAVAALVYAYNASKRLAEARGSGPVAASAGQRERQIVPDRCLPELRVAERALEARRERMPLDKLLRVREVIFEDDPVRRERLKDVAADWYLMEGDEPTPAELRAAVVEDCQSNAGEARD